MIETGSKTQQKTVEKPELQFIDKITDIPVGDPEAGSNGIDNPEACRSTSHAFR